jgi:hypothetical protein
MNTEELSAFYANLRDVLNPSFFVSESVSHRVMNVEWAIAGDSAETIRTCIFEIKEVMAARGFGNDLLLEVLTQSSSGEALQNNFLRIWYSRATIDELPELESLAVLAVYCFTQILFKDER